MALKGGEGSASLPGRSLPPGKTRYPLYRRLGGPQGRSGQVRKISLPKEIGSPDRPAPSQSLYRLGYIHILTTLVFNTCNISALSKFSGLIDFPSLGQAIFDTFQYCYTNRLQITFEIKQKSFHLHLYSSLSFLFLFRNPFFPVLVLLQKQAGAGAHTSSSLMSAGSLSYC